MMIIIFGTKGMTLDELKTKLNTEYKILEYAEDNVYEDILDDIRATKDKIKQLTSIAAINDKIDNYYAALTYLTDLAQRNDIWQSIFLAEMERDRLTNAEQICAIA